MKKTTEKTTEPKTTKSRKERKFFLYSEGNGFLRMTDNSAALPNFTDGELLWYTSKSQATFARTFFIQMKIADTLDILTKVA